MEHFGSTGTILKIDLSSQSAELVNTSNYADLSGGAPLAYRILLQELPTSLESAYDEGNVLVMAAGALTGSGIPGGCSLAVAALSPVTGTPCCVQMSGRLGSMMKHAGYDAVVITGAASSPVWINIKDNEVKMESASFLWGNGTHDTIAQICAAAGKETAVAAIGPAGENALDIASIVSPGSAAADGLGSVMGSKNLKAIALRGSGAVKLADPSAFAEKLEELCNTCIGVPGGSVVPAEPQSWSNFTCSTSWWNSKAGLYWGSAAAEVETGECPPGDMARMGFRTLSVVRDFGDEAADAVVRAVACPSCTSGCAAILHLPALERAGLSPYQLCGCDSLRAARGFMPKAGELPATADGEDETSQISAASFEYTDLEIAAAAASLAEDFGVGLLGGQLARNFRFAADSDVLKKQLSDSEYDSFDWAQYRAGDLNFLTDLFRRLAKNDSKFAILGTADVAETWEFGEEYQSMATAPVCGVKRPLDADALHGAAEAALAAVSPDELRRPMTQLLDCGLPLEIISEVVAAHCGTAVKLQNADSLILPEVSGDLMAWSAVQSYICSLLGLCGRLWPLSATPDLDSGYTADPDLAAGLTSLAMGEEITSRQLEEEALAGLCAARVLQCVHAKTLTPADDLDTVSPWVTQSGITEKDAAAALRQLYLALGWNEQDGLPLNSTLDSVFLNEASGMLAAVEAEAED